MPATLRQTNFSGGELSPWLHGRTDLPIHATGLRTALNVFVDRNGILWSRPGTEMIAATKVKGGPARLVPFQYSDAVSYVVEVGERYMRFFQGGLPVLDGSGNPVEVSTPYIEADLKELQWAQAGDKMTFTCPGWPVRQLERTSTGWLFGELSLLPQEARWVDINNQLTVMSQPMVVNTGGSPATSIFTEDFAHLLREWRWVVTAVIRVTATGVIYESRGHDIVRQYDGTNAAGNAAMPADNKVVLYGDRPVTIRRSATLIAGDSAVSPLTNGLEVLSYNYYRGRGELLGFVGSSKSGEFVDFGYEPDYLLQPPKGENPFSYVGNPFACAFYQERRVLAGTTQKPATAFFSETGAYENFDRRLLSAPGMSLEFGLAARRRERIRSLVPLQKLLMFTDSSVWSMAGSQGEPLDYNTVNAVVEDEVGATSLMPLVVDGCALFVRTKGQGVRALIPSQSGGFVGRDISTHSAHLFLGESFSVQGVPPVGPSVGLVIEIFQAKRQIIDWCYAEDPHGVIWAVREDGVLLSCAFNANGMAAWTRHQTDGRVKALCSVPEGTHDAVYMVVERYSPTNGPTRYIERMNRRVRNSTEDLRDPTDDGAVDCSVVYSGTPTQTLTGLDHLNGLDVWVTCLGESPAGPFRVVGGTIDIGFVPTPNTRVGTASQLTDVTLYVGLKFVADVELIDVATPETRTKQKTTNVVGFEVDQSKGIQVGQTFDNLTDAILRDVEDSYSTPSFATEVAKVHVMNRWDQFARACLRQSLPLPVTILGVTREVDVGG